MVAANYYFSCNVFFLGICLSLIATQYFLHTSSSVEAGFFADIMHRDSPESPLHNSSSTHFSRLHAAIHRSASRVDYLRRSHVPHFIDPPGLSASLVNHNFEFLMSFYIGSNKKKTFAGIDTGSYLIWVLCDPCEDCYEHIPTIFQPSSSKSYKQHACKITPCTLHPNTTCNNKGRCQYYTEYLDQTSVKGILSIDKLGLNLLEGNGIYDLHDITFGCTHKTTGAFDKGGIGLIGLNRAALSLVSQLGPNFRQSFSYCLPSKIDHRSRLNFGTAATVSGPGTMTTPLFHGFHEELYYLFLESITVGGEEPIVVCSHQDNQQGNILIDSGAFLTYIKPMQGLLKMVKMHIKLPPKKHNQYDLCFDTRGASEATKGLPKITFNFAGDAKFVLTANNAFTKIDHNTFCLLIVSSSRSGGLQIFGHRAQLGHLIGYDSDNEMLSFRKKDCRHN